MKDEDFKTIEAWMVEIHYSEDVRNGIGELFLVSWVRDDHERLKRLYDGMGRSEAKRIITDMIEKFTEPCEGYEDDMRFDFKGKPDLRRGGFSITFNASFRM